jgi:hypothetical protein
VAALVSLAALASLAAPVQDSWAAEDLPAAAVPELQVLLEVLVPATQAVKVIRGSQVVGVVLALVILAAEATQDLLAVPVLALLDIQEAGV